jgi:hypothetical protein
VTRLFLAFSARTHSAAPICHLPPPFHPSPPPRTHSPTTKKMPTLSSNRYVNTDLHIASYRQPFVDGLEEQRQCFEREQKRYAAYPREDYYTGNIEVKKTSTGEEMWSNFERLINGGLGWKLHTFQQEFMVMLKESLAPYVHGSSWDSVKENFIKKRGHSETPIRVCVASGPRRIGKSAVQALTMLSLSLSIPWSKLVLPTPHTLHLLRSPFFEHVLTTHLAHRRGVSLLG